MFKAILERANKRQQYNFMRSPVVFEVGDSSTVYFKYWLVIQTAGHGFTLMQLKYAISLLNMMHILAM